MKLKTIVAITGNDGQGKVAVVNALVSEIRKKYPRARFHTVKSVDQSKHLIITKGIAIGVEDLNDADERVTESLLYFVNEKCDVIICTVKNRAPFTSAVEALDEKYEIIWSSNYSTNERNRKVLNNLYAQGIIKMLEQYHPELKRGNSVKAGKK